VVVSRYRAAGPARVHWWSGVFGRLIEVERLGGDGEGSCVVKDAREAASQIGANGFRP
jgi:hypothetical protein